MVNRTSVVKIDFVFSEETEQIEFRGVIDKEFVNTFGVDIENIKLGLDMIVKNIEQDMGVVTK